MNAKYGLAGGWSVNLESKPEQQRRHYCPPLLLTANLQRSKVGLTLFRWTVSIRNPSMSFFDVFISRSDNGIPYEKISLWITVATSDAATRIYEGLEKGHLLKTRELESVFIPLCCEIASFYMSGCIAVVMNDCNMLGRENYSHIESRLFQEIEKLGQYHSQNKNNSSALFCKALRLPSLRSRTLAYCENDQGKLAVSSEEINRYADKYRPEIRNLPTEQTKVGCFLIRLLAAASVESIPFDAGQKLAELLIFNTAFDDVKGAIALQNAVAKLLREGK